MAETKPKSSDSLRTPKAKKKLGLSVPPALRMPHDDLISATMPEPVNAPSMTSQTSRSSQTSHTPLLAPVRDFSKVPNSITREVIPAGEFKGKSKQLYDCLYAMTRGALTPTKVVRISRPRLMRKAGIGSRVTFDSNIEHLCAIGLVEVRQIIGEHEGNEYSVYLPEERSLPSMTSQTSLTGYAQKLDRLVCLETSQTRHTLSVEDTATSGDPKTSFKTNTERSDDDEAYAALAGLLNKAVREVTGREPSANEQVRWAEVGEILVTELKIAAARTTVSNVPAFLAEHLRRRLFKKDKQQIEREATEPRPEPPASFDKTKCPDCGGSGYYYPEGYEKGVARCDHQKLREVETP
jgi:hypothetical protein